MSLKQKQSQILKIPKAYLTSTPPAPKSVKIELVSRCNYRCKYCAFTLRKQQPNKDMDWELFERITTEMKEIGVEEIGPFYIGESFMNVPLLVKAVDFLKNILGMPYVFLTSNASLANPDSVNKVMSAGLDSLKWSCNASSDNQFQDFMGVSHRNLDVAKENIKSAWDIRNKNNYPTRLYASSIRYNDEQAKQAEPFLRKHVLPYVDMHYWLPLYSAGGESKFGKPMAGNPGRWDDPSEPIPCWTLFTAAHIMVDGKMTACCLDGSGKWVMGDLTKQSFMEAWHSKDFINLRQAHISKNIKDTICERCALIA